MPKYVWRIEFEAEDDEDAKQMVYGNGVLPGAEDKFGDIHSETLEHEDGSRV